MEIHQIPVMTDNYIYLLRDPGQGTVAVVDPAEAAPVQTMLQQFGWNLDLILNTHHHADHVGGNRQLKAHYGCHIIGPKADEQRIPGIDQALEDGEMGTVGLTRFQFIDTPGHTRGHGVYWFADDHTLFCGDTLFSLGCGRLFEGSPQQMWQSLLKIRALPDATMVYCAHEYTAANAKFALTIEPDNCALKDYAAEIFDRRRQDQATVPFNLGREKACNPFLRADLSSLRERLAMSEEAEPAEVFASIRRRKDQF